MKRNDAKQTEEILELFLDQFMFDEPLSQNLNFSRADAEPIYRGTHPVANILDFNFHIPLSHHRSVQPGFALRIAACP